MPESDYKESWEFLGAISSALIESNDDAELHFAWREATGWPDWYLHLISQIYAVVRRSPIQYATSNIKSPSDPHGQVLLFTDKLVVEATVARNPEQPTFPAVSVKAWRRTDLVDVAIVEIDNYPATDVRYARSWPRWMSVTLAYRDRPPVVLPLSNRPSRDAQLTLVDVYGSFVDDLLA